MQFTSAIIQRPISSSQSFQLTLSCRGGISMMKQKVEFFAAVFFLPRSTVVLELQRGRCVQFRDKPREKSAQNWEEEDKMRQYNRLRCNWPSCPGWPRSSQIVHANHSPSRLDFKGVQFAVLVTVLCTNFKRRDAGKHRRNLLVSSKKQPPKPLMESDADLTNIIKIYQGMHKWDYVLRHCYVFSLSLQSRLRERSDAEVALLRQKKIVAVQKRLRHWFLVQKMEIYMSVQTICLAKA